MIYIVSKRRAITGDKIKNAQKTYEKLVRREKHEGMTPWLVDAFAKSVARLKKMGLSHLTKTKV
jgi:hypothetical protein